MSYNPLERAIGSGISGKSDSTQEKRMILDDFDKKSDYWIHRRDGVSDIVYEGSAIQLVVGPTEALYYSNAEIADGDFSHLPWEPCNFEAKVKLVGEHFGSAGWGFWNYSMVLEESVPIWFVYLRSRSAKYPLNGLYVQVGNIFTPIKYFKKPPLSLRIGLKLLKKVLPIKFTAMSPVMRKLDLSEWHIYRILRNGKTLVFYIDENKISEIGIPKSKYRFRADAWIDNAVFTPLKGDYARVYRHVTHENRGKAILAIDYIKIWL
ncbi:MAG TPA: hypothetical protein ENF41_05000 [Candidatus Bathyarchaeota archaeon]|nr:hypothetical protein [Candidatus Bathyarchaeota archaeon]